MANDMSKTEYLKRYLEKDKKKSKSKIKYKHNNPLLPRVKIVDKNIDLKLIQFGEKEIDEKDEAPVIADIIDERPEEVKIKEIYKSSRWKKLESEAGDSEDNTNSALIKPQLHDKNSNDKTKDNSISKKELSALHNKKRHDSDSDNSPPRISDKKYQSNTKRDLESDTSHPTMSSKNSKRYDSDSDNSPPRMPNRHTEKQYRKAYHKKTAADRITKNTEKKFDSDSDFSPETLRIKGSSSLQRHNKSGRGTSRSDSDLSPERKSNIGKYEDSLKNDHKRPMKTLSGLKAGLQNAATLRKETQELRLREKRHINALDAERSGRNAETIVRDRSGKMQDLEEENRIKEAKEKKKAEELKKYSEWGKGIAQTETKTAKLNEDLYEMSKPLARYCDDEDLEDRLKSVIHDDDPMSAYIRKKRRKENVSSMPEYSGPPPPPSRFGIKPGYRWDGVDRSNGFEKKYFEKHSMKKSIQEEAYLWSVQNM